MRVEEFRPLKGCKTAGGREQPAAEVGVAELEQALKGPGADKVRGLEVQALEGPEGATEKGQEPEVQKMVMCMVLSIILPNPCAPCFAACTSQGRLRGRGRRGEDSELAAKVRD